MMEMPDSTKERFRLEGFLCFVKFKVKLTVSIQRAGQPFPPWVIIHSEDLHTLVLSYTEVQFSSSMPVMSDSGCMNNLQLPLHLQSYKVNNNIKLHITFMKLKVSWLPNYCG